MKKSNLAIQGGAYFSAICVKINSDNSLTKDSGEGDSSLCLVAVKDHCKYIYFVANIYTINCNFYTVVSNSICVANISDDGDSPNFH